jgi:ribosomal protein L7/L12
MVAEGLIVSALVVLTPTEQEKLECKDLEKAINNIANDLHVKWAVEVNGNIATATISKQFGPVVGESQAHEVEIVAANFMRGIEHLVVPCDKKQLDTPKNDEEEETNTPATERVITFCVNSNAVRVIKAIRECTNATLETAKQYARKGRIVCAPDEVESIIENLEVAGASDVHIDEELTNNLTFCKAFIDDWEDEETTGFVCGADVACAFRDMPGLFAKCGTISGDLLKDMFIAYIQSV